MRAVTAALMCLAFGLFPAGCGSSSDSDGEYRIEVSGQITTPQQVGQEAELDVTLRNTGDAPMPNPALDFEDNDPWTVAGTSPQSRALGSAIYVFDPLQPGKMLNVTFYLVPNEAGNFTLKLFAYGDVNEDVGVGKGDTEGIEWSVAVLPG
jgi:hypothetical protein